MLYNVPPEVPIYSRNRFLIGRKTLTNDEDFEFRDESPREPKMGNMVDVQGLFSANPLIFPPPRHICGQVHCLLWFVKRAKLLRKCGANDGF